MRSYKWQWMDNQHGGMGWFTSAQKGGRVRADGKRSDGYWRKLTPEEVAEFARYVGRLSCEQS